LNQPEGFAAKGNSSAIAGDSDSSLGKKESQKIYKIAQAMWRNVMIRGKKKIHSQESSRAVNSTKPRPYRQVWVIIIGLLSIGAALTFAVRAYNSKTVGSSSPVVVPLAVTEPAAIPLRQSGAAAATRWQSKLALQPQADRMRLQLGKRFRAPGKEISTLTGTLTLNSQNRAIRITRTQAEDGEQVTIALDGGAATYIWNQEDGAKLAGNSVSGEAKAFLERIILDSPDQFILSQLRGASYQTIASQVVPEEAAKLEIYEGPAWNVVRIEEPLRAGFSKPESLWRMYYINSETGLLDRIISTEQGETILAELSSWGQQDGEMVPGRITWSRNNQVVMEIVFSGLTYSAR
jgi:hypothetical protein